MNRPVQAFHSGQTGPILKICGNRFIEDSLFVASRKPDIMGWIFSPRSVRRITVQEAHKQITRIRQLHPQILHAAVFASNTVQEIRQVVEMVPGIDLLQIVEGAGFIENARRFVGTRKPILPVHRINGPIKDEQSIRPVAAPLHLLDAYVPGQPGGTGSRIELTWIETMDTPYLLAGGLQPDNVFGVLEQSQALGVDVSSGLEFASSSPFAAPGRKDHAKVTAFVEAVRSFRCKDRWRMQKMDRARRRLEQMIREARQNDGSGKKAQ